MQVNEALVDPVSRLHIAAVSESRSVKAAAIVASHKAKHHADRSSPHLKVVPGVGTLTAR